METTEKEILRGGQFLVKESRCEDIFTPEDFSDHVIHLLRDRDFRQQLISNAHQLILEK